MLFLYSDGTAGSSAIVFSIALNARFEFLTSSWSVLSIFLKYHIVIFLSNLNIFCPSLLVQESLTFLAC